MEENSYPCPACGFLVFDGFPGSYEICPVCLWEDDQVQLKHPLMSGGANSISLLEHQQKLLNTISVTLREFDGYKRAHGWRPLSEKDCANSSYPPKSGQEYFQAVIEASPLYYWQKDKVDD
jgi:hypothetical protein